MKKRRGTAGATARSVRATKVAHAVEGAAGGAAAGAAAGAIAGPVGSIVGAVLGGAAGAVAENVLGREFVRELPTVIGGQDPLLEIAMLPEGLGQRGRHVDVAPLGPLRHRLVARDGPAGPDSRG